MKWVKHLAKRSIRYLVAKLPPGGQESVLDSLCEIRTPEVAFYRLATKLNVVGLSVRGNYGIISQSVLDRVMLPFYAKNGCWAPQTNRMLVNFFAAVGGGTYIDVGANIGLTTIPVAQNPNVDCIAIEPEPINFSYLSGNVAANCPHSNVTMRRLAAFSEYTKLRFEISPDNLGDHRIRLNDAIGQMNEQQRKTIEVDAGPLDDLVIVKRAPLVVKIDTEGAEPFVVGGGRKILEQAKLLIMEIWPYGITRMGGDATVIASLIRDVFENAIFVENDHPSDQMAAGFAAGRILEVIQQHSMAPRFYIDVIAAKNGVSLKQCLTNQFSTRGARL
jgi:FkbM family methyltransferase